MSRSHPLSSRARTGALALAAAVTLVACGGDDDDTAEVPASMAPAASSDSTEVAAATTAPAAATSSTTDSTAMASFPVTIEHALGTAEIPARPTRVVTLGYGEGDIVAALGVAPLAVNAYGTRAGLPTPWFDEAVAGADVELLDLVDGIPYERIAALEPELILAASSNIEAADYELLSGIAPTVAYRTAPFQDSWEDAALTAGRALGVEDEAGALIADVERTIAEAAAAHPELEDRTVSVVLAISPDQVGVLNAPAENTVRMLTGLGMQLPPAVSSLEIGPTGYSAVISLEQTGTLDADVLLLYAISDEARQALTTSPVFANLPVTARGDVLAIEPDVWSALRAPSVLSIPYAVDQLVEPLAVAVGTD